MQTLPRPAAPSTEELLPQHPLFGDLPAPYMRTLAACAADAHFRAGDLVFEEGHEADRFYLIRDGEVALEVFRLDGGPTTIQTLEEGDAFGWSWLVPPFRWRFDARAVRDTHAIVFDGVRLRQLCEQQPQLGYELFKRFALLLEERLQHIRMHLLGLNG